MKTFREDLVRAAFEDRWPPFSTAEERKAFLYDRRDETPGSAEMRRAYELGAAHRERGLTADEKGELDMLADSDGWFARWEVEARTDRDMREAWDRALGLTQ